MGKFEKDRTEKLIELKKKLKSIEQEYKQNDQIWKDLEDRNKKLNIEIRTLSNTVYQLETTIEKEDLVVTDHAVLRYIERKYKLPIEDTRKEILDLLKSYDVLGKTEKFKGFVIRGNSVITYKD